MSKKSCFVVSPIGRAGSEINQHFQEVLDYVIKPAIDGAGMSLEVVRADEIQRPGSFLKDIVEQLYNAHLVIADLTGQNANVFYELGIRHALSPRTIMIASSIDDVPSDLRQYRVIVYDTTAKGATFFRNQIEKFLLEIEKEPDRSDNPVLDSVPVAIQNRFGSLESENAALKKQIEDILKKGVKGQTITSSLRPTEDTTSRRMDRILKILSAEKQYLGSWTSAGKDGPRKTHRAPKEEGAFSLYFITHGDSILSSAYVAVVSNPDWETLFADMRVLMAQTSGKNMHFNFIVATNIDFSERMQELKKKFGYLLKHLSTEDRRYFSFELLDRDGLLKKEVELGIKAIEISTVVKPARASQKGKSSRVPKKSTASAD